ncbi:MAG TPA: type II toxin-antitoxin system PemK/MazF family toxin [Nocardioidaceae bacterium]|nr:type II toxin-antitoxin system PemK/MazF family toxin [Nocardioidaceae bacterium]
MTRGEIWWVDFGEPFGSAPGYRRPAVIVSSDRFNRSRLATVIVAAVTSNTRLADAPGNVQLPEGLLPQRSVVNVTQLLAIDRKLLRQRIAAIDTVEQHRLDEGLRLVLGV